MDRGVKSAIDKGGAKDDSCSIQLCPTVCVGLPFMIEFQAVAFDFCASWGYTMCAWLIGTSVRATSSQP